MIPATPKPSQRKHADPFLPPGRPAPPDSSRLHNPRPARPHPDRFLHACSAPRAQRTRTPPLPPLASFQPTISIRTSTKHPRLLPTQRRSVSAWAIWAGADVSDERLCRAATTVAPSASRVWAGAVGCAAGLPATACWCVQNQCQSEHFRYVEGGE